MTIGIIGSLSQPRNVIEQAIIRLGGEVKISIVKGLTAVISNREEIAKMDCEMEEAKKFNIQVVSEDFLSAVQSTDPIEYIRTQKLSAWGSDVGFFNYIFESIDRECPNIRFSRC